MAIEFRVDRDEDDRVRHITARVARGLPESEVQRVRELVSAFSARDRTIQPVPSAPIATVMVELTQLKSHIEGGVTPAYVELLTGLHQLRYRDVGEEQAITLEELEQMADPVGGAVGGPVGGDPKQLQA